MGGGRRCWLARSWSSCGMWETTGLVARGYGLGSGRRNVDGCLFWRREAEWLQRLDGVMWGNVPELIKGENPRLNTERKSAQTFMRVMALASRIVSRGDVRRGCVHEVARRFQSFQRISRTTRG